MKVFTELTPECDITAQMYAAGYEKKEIAVLKHRCLLYTSDAADEL